MKKFLVTFVGILLVGLSMIFAAQSAFAVDVVTVAPDVKVLLENDRVRVLESTLKPGEVEGMHTHPAYVAYFLTPTTVKITTPDGNSSVKKPPAGKVLYGDSAEHQIENVGDTLQRVLVIELKQ
jgi:quercetin dioxygenase-like cupin family protein